MVALYLLTGDMNHWHGLLSLLIGWEHGASVYFAKRKLFSGCQSRNSYASYVGGNKAGSLQLSSFEGIRGIFFAGSIEYHLPYLHCGPADNISWS